MTAKKLHASEVTITSDLVRRLLLAQFPQWADLPIKLLEASGTDNVIFRLGGTMAVKLPRIASAAQQIDKEFLWLPHLAPHLPLAIPTMLGKGLPGDGYPWPWLIFRWLTGENAFIEPVADLQQAARDLGNFVASLERIDTSGAPLVERGKPLSIRDQETRAALNSLHGIIDISAATTAWQVALDAPEWAGPPVWIHGDLQPANLLVSQGRLSAVIDFGLTGIGDPACDMMVAWTLLSKETRGVFRNIVQVDDATWARGRGWALTFGLVALPYYQNTNPMLAQIARRTLDEVLADQ